jgi:hypothetical protein
MPQRSISAASVPPVTLVTLQVTQVTLQVTLVTMPVTLVTLPGKQPQQPPRQAGEAVLAANNSADPIATTVAAAAAITQ